MADPIDGKKKRVAPIDAAALMRRVERDINRKHGLPKGTITANPLQVLFQLAAGEWPDSYVQASIAGRADDIKGKLVPLDVILDSAKIAARFLYPQLSSSQVSGPEGGPIPVSAEGLLVAAMMMDPIKRRMLEDLQLTISADVRRKALAAPATIVVETTAETILDAEEIDDGPALNQHANSNNSSEDRGSPEAL